MPLSPIEEIGCDTTRPMTSAEAAWLREQQRASEGGAVAAARPKGTVNAYVVGMSNADPEVRGAERGHAYLQWLHSEVDQRPVAPLDAFR